MLYPIRGFCLSFARDWASNPNNFMELRTHLSVSQTDAREARMFCNRCGTEMLSEYAACPKCGRKLGDPVRDLACARLDGHLHTLGLLWIIVGGVFVIPAAALLIFGGVARFVIRGAGPWAGLVPLLVYLAGSTLVILAAGGICVGMGLRQRQPWARVSAIVLGALA